MCLPESDSVSRSSDLAAHGADSVTPVPMGLFGSYQGISGRREKFLAEVRKYQGRRIRRLDWLPGEYFTADGGSTVTNTHWLDDDLMTGVLVTPSGEPYIITINTLSGAINHPVGGRVPARSVVVTDTVTE